MKIEIEEIKESLEKAIENLTYYDGFDSIEWSKALVALDLLSVVIKRLEEELQGEYESQAGASL